MSFYPLTNWYCVGCGRANNALNRSCVRCGAPRLISASGKIVAAGLDLATFVPFFATITRVPIVMAGVEYQLSTGPATFTPEDVMDFVASQEDPAIVPPRLKIGHTSRLSQSRADGILKDGDDGVPALGKFINIDFDPTTLTAVGDLAGVPVWMAKLLKAGLLYPSRSIEGFQGAETVTGKEWGLVVHAVALLGCVWPGCSTLDDLPLLYTEDGPDDLELYDEEGALIEVGNAAQAVAASGRARTAAPARPVEAAVNVDDVRRAFYNELGAMDLDNWSWIRAIYLDPNELIVDDDDGSLWRVPFTISGDTVEFTDPQEVRVQYVDASSGRIRRQLALTASRGALTASYASRGESRQSVTNSNGEDIMTPEQLAALGLPTNATRAQIHARLITLASETDPSIPEDDDGEDDGETPPETPATPATPAAPEGEPETPTTPPAPSAPATTAGGIDPSVLQQLQQAGLSVVPSSTLDSIQRDAATGAAHARQSAEERRESLIASAIREGRIRSGDAPTYRNMFAATATAQLAETLLTASVEQGGLRPGMVPVEERGEIPAGDAGSSELSAATYDDSWLTPAERQRRDAVAAGTFTPPLIQSDQRLNAPVPSA